MGGITTNHLKLLAWLFIGYTIAWTIVTFVVASSFREDPAVLYISGGLWVSGGLCVISIAAMTYFSVKSASKPRKALAIALFCYMSQQAALGFALHRYSRGNEYITSAIFVTIGAVLVLLGIASKKGVLCALG